MTVFRFCKGLALFTLILFLLSCEKKEEDFSQDHHPIHWSEVSFEAESSLKEAFFDDGQIISNNHNLEILSRQRSDDDIINMIQYLIDYQDDQSNFIPSLVENIGYPVWSEAEILSSIVFIPFVGVNANATTAILLVRENEGVFTFKLLLRDRVYNNIIQENYHQNFEIELFSFIEFDQRLFDAQDPILVDYLSKYSDGLAVERCPIYVEWLCLGYWYGPFNFNNPCVLINGDNNCRLCVPVYFYSEDCHSGPVFGGWGNTNGNNTPPTEGGESDYNNGGGGSGSNGGGGNNPMDWWEELAYRNVLISIIEELELTQEDIFLTECLNSDMMLLSNVYRVMENIDVESDGNKEALISAITSACTCDNYDEQGREQCNEIEDFQEAILEEKYEVNIVETILIDGVLYGVDEDSILHIFIDPIDMDESTEEEILNQVIDVLNKIHLYFCEGNTYEPIDWRDYFDNVKTKHFTTNWNNDCTNVTLNLNVSISPYYIMETDPSWNGDNGSRYFYKWVYEGTNIPCMQIIIPYECTEELEAAIFPEC